MASASSETKAPAASTVHRGIKQVVTASKMVEGGGFVVRRPLGSKQIDYADPFLMLDHMGPITYGPGEGVGAPDHPHRGFETVSYILEGSMQHRDSQGNSGNLKAGDVQWMTAGRGVIHSEMPSDEMQAKGGTVEGFQLWVNLPRKDKMINPRYQDTPSAKIPEVLVPSKTDSKVVDAVRTRVIAGESHGKHAVIDTRTPIMYLDIQLNEKGVEYETAVPSTFNGFVYVYRGVCIVGSTELKEGQLGTLTAGTHLHVKAAANSTARLLLIAGVPLNEPITKYGPFVMSTEAEIMQAFRDYQSGEFGKIEGAEARAKQTADALKKSGGPKGL